MQSDRQIRRFELELLLREIRLDELDIERAHLARALVTERAPPLEQRRIPIERERRAPEELGRQARKVAAPRPHVDDSSGAPRERLERPEQRAELFPLARRNPSERRRRKRQRPSVELR